MSKLFNNSSQILDHGADLYSGYLDDKPFVEEIEKQKMSPSFFTISFTLDALKYNFPHHYDDIFQSFCQMLVFDAVIGINDRHYYNWGVLRHIRGHHAPRFSPIYDTARALFWNNKDDHLEGFDSVARTKYLEKYVRNSKPKTGVEKNNRANHLDIIKTLNSNKFNGTSELVHSMITEKNLSAILSLIHDEFTCVLSDVRKSIITECVTLRFKYLKDGL